MHPPSRNTQGKALVASPYLMDPHFMRSVVYMMRHDNSGAVGVILNRPSLKTVGDLLHELADVDIINSAPVYCGGPVDGPVMMLQACNQAPLCGEEVVTIDSDHGSIANIYAKLSADGVVDSRLFEGYAGWGPGQLESELREGGWLVWDIPANLILSDCEELWQNALREIGLDILSGGIDRSRVPVDPAYN